MTAQQLIRLLKLLPPEEQVTVAVGISTCSGLFEVERKCVTTFDTWSARPSLQVKYTNTLRQRV